MSDTVSSMSALRRKLRTAYSVFRQRGMRLFFGWWKAGHAAEVEFWDEFFRTRGSRWPGSYTARLNPGSLLQPRPAALLPDAPEASILDVGAGPLTSLGKTVPGKRLHITAVDPLADGYDAVLAKYGVTPPVRTEKLPGEELTKRFAAETFDLVHARNCLDHAYNPVKAIEQMIQVAKRGGYVLLEHHPNEADKQEHRGLHQWNFTTNAAGDFVISGRSGAPVNVSERFQQSVSTHCDYVDDGEPWLVVTMRKKA